MKKSAFILMIFILLSSVLSGCASSPSGGEANSPSSAPDSIVSSGQSESAPSTEITTGSLLTVQLTFNRASTMASNQYAVWIENADGELVKTLYVSTFTGNGGFARRAESLPTWVSKANPAEMDESEIDAITSATPQNGVQTHTWDGTDENGAQVSAGEYRVYVEGTLYWTSSVLYSGSFEWGGDSENIELTPTYTEAENEANKDMITQVSAQYSSGA